MAKTVTMRGLQTFISDVRACQSKEAEKTRVDKELGKIRKKFASDKNMSDYDKKKYIWKLLYIYMLGYDVEFGHKQACDLIPAGKYAEKQVGYTAAAVLLNENDEFLRLVINSVRNDLTSRNEAYQCLGLCFVANVGSPEMAQLLAPDVMNILTSGSSRPIVRKKAALALLRLIRKSPPDAEILPTDVWSVKMAALLEERNIGLLLTVVTMMLGIVSRNYEGYENCVPKLIAIMERMKKKEVPSEYTYHQIPSPWLQVKCMRVLQYFPPPDDPVVKKALGEILRGIITGTEVVKNLNKNNAQHAIVFEAVALALAVDADTEVLNAGVALLGKFITVREPNIKYLGLENMCRLAEVPAVIDAIHRHHKSIVTSLSDPDISIRRRALDLLFAMCNSQNVQDIVQELLNYMDTADLSMREELVLKLALLAERFFPSLQWYVDSMLTLIEKAGDFATRDVWFSVVQLVTNHEELHQYAAAKVVEKLRAGASHEAFLCCAAFVLGEYGRLLTDVTVQEQFQMLHKHFGLASVETKAIMLSAYLKLDMVNPNDTTIKNQCQQLFTKYAGVLDAELQQRASEYSVLATRPDVARANLLPMPKWEKRRSLLLRKLEESQGEADEMRERPAWMQEDAGEGSLPNGTTAAAPLSVTAPPPTTSPKAVPLPEVDLLGAELDPAPTAPVANGVASAAAPQANGSGPAGLTDILDLLAGPTPTPAAAAPAAPTTADPFAVPGSSDLAAGLHDIRPIGDIGQWYSRLCIRDSGVLYEDQYLQVGVKSQYQSSTGQLVLFLGNKSNQQLTRLVCAVPPAPGLLVQQTPPPQALVPMQQVQVSINVTCIASFLQAPQLQLSYTLGAGPQAMSQTLQLPIVLSKFCRKPDNAVPADVFFSRWKAIPGPPYKITETVSRPTPLLPAAIQEMLDGLRLAVQPGIDTEPANFVAVATLSHGEPPMPVQVPIMLRLEVEKVQRQTFQVTVASNEIPTTSAIKDLLCKLLAST